MASNSESEDPEPRDLEHGDPEALIPEPGEFYYDGPYLVFTEAYHLRRGYCCQSGCRHCPFGFRIAASDEV